MNGDLIKVNLTQDEHYENKRIDDLREKAKDLPKLFYCDCCRSIARFYLLELEYNKRRQPMMVKKRRQKNKVKFVETQLIPRFWHDSYEDYYTKEFSEVASIVLRFTLCAALGEARHTIHSVVWSGEQAKKNIYNSLRVMFGSLGWRYIPLERNSVYRVYTPERLWWKLFMHVKEVFGAEGWGSAFGGAKWEKGIELAMKTYKAICLGDRAGVVIWLDTLINHCHNGGLMLNKFNCGGYYYFTIKKLLDSKHLGNIETLTSTDTFNDCLSYNNVNCNKFVLLAPTD